MRLRIELNAEIETEEVVIFAREKCDLIDEIEALMRAREEEMYGYRERECFKLSAADVLAFTVEGGRVFAVTESGKYLVRERIYELEEKYPELMIKINQSTIVNTSKIVKFDASISGALLVVLKGGFCDYVSRRQLKHVRQRMGI